MPYPEWLANSISNEPTVVLSKEDAREAARLLKILADAIDEPPGHVTPEIDSVSRQDLILKARITLNNRRLRAKHFSPSMFGEPAWDMMLVLFVTEVSGERQSIGHLAEWIETPLSTAVRWIDYLEKKQLVEREAHRTDKRITFIKLSNKGRDLLDSYLRETPWDPDQAI